ncbi:MAG: ABC transporter ATP-binding protein [Anaerolineae bacterium]
MSELLRVESIRKIFPGLVANADISLSVAEGEVLALLGENGAGKSTLMNCIYGLHQPDGGHIFWQGQETKIPDSRTAVELGIGMVHQHFMLIPVFSVVENIALGLRSSRGLRLDLDRVEQRLIALSAEFGLEVDPHALVWQLPVGAQQRVEILKALYRNTRLLILDEPTAVLTPGEVKDLIEVLHRLTQKGLGIIFISHKLEEVMAVSDRVVVLRDGRLVGHVDTAKTTARELAYMMVGREVILNLPKSPAKPGVAALEVRNLSAPGERGLPALRQLSFELHTGEILGLAGVDGNGQLELEEVICGLRAATEGEIRLFDQKIDHCPPAERHSLGLAHIPSDRLDRGQAAGLSIAENLVASQIDQPPYSQRGQLNLGAIQQFARRAISQFNIRALSPQSPVSTLSGGNQQRVVLASALGHQPRVVIAAQPTRGLDVGVTQQVYERLLAERAKGTAILLISTELEEILALSDRLAVMYRGELMGILPTATADIHTIGLMMAGRRLASNEVMV